MSFLSNFWTVMIVTNERRVIIRAAGHQISNNEMKDHNAKTTVFVYMKFIQANSFKAVEALFILSIVFPEWLSVCHSMGSDAT